MEQDIFDIRSGMDVHGADGQKIGTVAEVAGFGSSEVADPSEAGSADLVTQAQTGTGYFKMDPIGDVGRREDGAVVVPFNGIANVSLERGVTLNDTVMETLRRQKEEPRAPEKLFEPKSERRWWSLFLAGSGRKP